MNLPINTNSGEDFTATSWTGACRHAQALKHIYLAQINDGQLPGVFQELTNGWSEFDVFATIGLYLTPKNYVLQCYQDFMSDCAGEALRDLVESGRALAKIHTEGEA